MVYFAADNSIYQVEQIVDLVLISTRKTKERERERKKKESGNSLCILILRLILERQNL